MLKGNPILSSLRLAAVTAALAGGTVLAQSAGSYGGSPAGLDLIDVDFMFVGAHPDDESGMTATMARYVLDQGYRATVITLTQGEGGGNATGPEVGPSLGAIRAEELRRSLETVGVKTHYFLGQNDFYYTLFAEQAQKVWGDKFICDVTRVVRLTRPEVIVTMWPGVGTHGHHQMAGRAATIAYERAGDPSFCPEQITGEFIKPWTPLKLYYATGTGATLSIPTGDFSRSAYMTYADLKAMALSSFRSQGFDQYFSVPVKNPGSENFRLVDSRVPIQWPETHLLAGAVTGAGNSPAGLRLEVKPASYKVGVGENLPVTVTLTNTTDQPLSDVRIALNAPTGWASQTDSAETYPVVAPGKSIELKYSVSVPSTAEAVGQGRLWAAFTAASGGLARSGQNYAWYEAVSPVEARFQPLFDIAGYRSFAAQTGTEFLVPSLNARVPITIGESTPVTVELSNRSGQAQSGELTLTLPDGITAAGSTSFQLAANGSSTVKVDVTVPASLATNAKHSFALKGQLSTSIGGFVSSDTADLYALPTLTVPRVTQAPTIDGDLADMAAAGKGSVAFEDVWEGKADNNADSSADFFVAYDDKNLYVGTRVYDQSVVCNIAPDDIRGHWRSDSVEITIDPSGASADTSSTFKTGIFPCTTEGFVARAERDADANQGPIEQTAPGMKVASKKLADGYTIEAAIPWSAMPSQPAAGGKIGFNVLVYDGDQADARPGANVGESRIGWASVINAEQATPYVWPKVTLGR